MAATKNRNPARFEAKRLANNADKPALGMAALFATIIFSTTTIVMLRVSAVEKTIEDVKKDSADQRTLIRKSLEEHIDTRGHASTLEELAAIQKMFAEVETQFRAAKDHQEQADQYIGERLMKLEGTDDRRGEEWLSRIVRLEERTDGKRKEP